MSSVHLVRQSKQFQKLAKISLHVQKMLGAKKAIDAALAIITACKAAFENLKSVTLFAVDLNLQQLLSNRGKNKRHYKEIPCEGVIGH
jgi:hypothetical protein